MSQASMLLEAGKLPLPLVQDQIDAELAHERQRLLDEAGLGDHRRQFKRPVEHQFLRSERETTTILFGGLTVKHDEMIVAGMRGLGYKITRLPTPVKADFQAGKEFGNNGQCNPTYFTVGNLVNYLKDLRDKNNIPTEQVVRNYVFVTAGACGPCRFGMYEAEFRLALRNSGFDGFRVLLFDQGAGVDQVTEGSALEMNLSFFLVILNALFIGDLVNEVGYHIRPYEVVPGSTDAALAECQKLCEDALQGRDFANIRGNFMSQFVSKRTPMLSGPDDLAKITDQLFGDHFPKVMRACKDLLNEKVQVDYTRAKPIVKVTGEFWAQTTEGDGNFHMFRFLEGEGAQVLTEPVATWIGYMLHLAIIQFKDRGGLDHGQAPPKSLLGKVRQAWKYRFKLGVFNLGNAILGRCYARLRHALGNTAHSLVNQTELQKLAEPFYHSQAEGGEGYMEVGKNIYYASKNMAHMVLSLKPFGCMPSTQSDGAQAAVTSAYPDMIFLPIETSGEGDINAYSRTQMALGEAKVKCKTEFQEVTARCGYPLEQVRQYAAEHMELRRPIQEIPHQKGVIGQGAGFVLHVASLMKTAGVQPKTV